MADEYWNRYWQKHSSRRRFLAGAGVAGAGAATLALVGCGDDDDDDEPAPGGTTAPAATTAPVLRGGTLRYPMVGVSSGDPPTLYPYENLTYLAQIPAAAHYSRLIRNVARADLAVEDKTVFEGDICSKWEVVDPTHFTFTLKPNLKWQNKPPMNGRAATATDWKKTYEVFAKASPNAAKFGGIIDSVEAPDEKTIKITLKSPYAPFLVSIAASAEGIWFIPVETIDSGQAKQDPVGTGPFFFRSFTPGVSIKWDRNPDYVDSPLPNFDKIEAGMSNDPQRIVAALQSGDIDLSLLNGSIFRESRSKLDAKGTDFFIQSAVEGGMFFNFDNTPFQDKRVRQALSMIMDRDGMLKVQDGTGKGSYMSHQPPAMAPYFLDPRDAKFGPNGKYFKRNLTEAKALLSAASAEGLQFKLIANVDRYGAEYKQIWELTTASFQEAGLKPELVYQEYATYIQSTFLGKIPAGTAAMGPFIGSANDPDDVFAALYWTKSARHNWGGTPIPEQAEIDTRIEKQRTILVTKERIEYIHEMQRLMADSMLTVPYHLSAGYLYSQPWLKNFHLKIGYPFLPEGLMQANFDAERLKKG